MSRMKDHALLADPFWMYSDPSEAIASALRLLGDIVAFHRVVTPANGLTTLIVTTRPGKTLKFYSLEGVRIFLGCN